MARPPAHGYVGVSHAPKNGRWHAIGYHRGKTTFLGAFERIEDAATAVDRVNIGLGSGRRLNFPDARLEPASVEAMREWASDLMRDRTRRLGKPGLRSTEYRGVRVESGRYRAYVRIGTRSALLGGYDDAREAALARDRAVLHLGLDEALNLPARAAKLGPCSIQELRRQSRMKGSRGKSRFFGVMPNPYSDGWDARVTVGRKGMYIARFPTEEDAARAHDRAALRLLRDPLLNFPHEGLKPASIATLRKEAAASWPLRRTSALHGVQKTTRTGGWPWLAVISIAYRNVPLGAWRTEREAALAHDRAALCFPSERRKLNFPAAARKAGPATPAELRHEAWLQVKATKSSRYRGVSWAKKDQVWRASIGHRGEQVHLGSFHDEELAAEAYDTAARRLHKKKAKLNFP